MQTGPCWHTETPLHTHAQTHTLTHIQYALTTLTPTDPLQPRACVTFLPCCRLWFHSPHRQLISAILYFAPSVTDHLVKYMTLHLNSKQIHRRNFSVKPADLNASPHQLMAHLFLFSAFDWPVSYRVHYLSCFDRPTPSASSASYFATHPHPNASFICFCFNPFCTHISLSI